MADERIEPGTIGLLNDPTFNEMKFYETIRQLPHKKQLLAHKTIDHPDVNTLVILAHRRWGKSIFMKQVIEKFMIKYPGIRVFLGAPTYKLCTRVCDDLFSDVRLYWKDLLRGHARYSRHEIGFDFKNGSSFVATGMDNPNSAIGSSIDLALFDEFQLISEEAYNLFLPAISDKARMGKQIICGTPRMVGVFSNLASYGLEEEGRNNGEWTMRFPYDEEDPAPYVKASEYERQKRILPKKRFESEWKCKFELEGGMVFSFDKTNFMPRRQRRVMPRETIGIGIDIGKQTDFTVATALTTDRKMVGFKRIHETDWPQILRELKDFIRIYSNNNPAFVCIDATGKGSMAASELSNYFASHPNVGGNITEIVFTAQLKEVMIEELQTEMEHKNLIMWDDEDIKDELANFIYIKTDSGNKKYQAGVGKHDDIVSSLMLANWALKSRREGGIDIV